MKISKEQEIYNISKIRRLLVVDNRMSTREMQQQLLENGLDLDIRYVGKLRDKVLKQRAMTADRVTLNLALGRFADTLGEVIREAWTIVLSNSTDKRTKVSALKEIRESERDLFDKLFDAGVFTKNLGKLDLNILRNIPLRPEVVDGIAENMKNWGIEIPDNKLIPTATEKPSENGNEPITI